MDNELSKVQQLNLRLATSRNDDELRAVLKESRALGDGAGADDVRTLRQIEAIAELRLGRFERGLEIFRSEISCRRGSSRDGFLSVLSAYLDKLPPSQAIIERILEFLKYPASPLVRGEYLYHLVQSLGDEAIAEADWEEPAREFFESVGASPRELTLDSFFSYASKFFSDRSKINRAMMKDEEPDFAGLQTQYWRQKLT